MCVSRLSEYVCGCVASDGCTFVWICEKEGREGEGEREGGREGGREREREGEREERTRE